MLYFFLFSSCRKGSVIVNFTVTFEAVNSEEILNFMENTEKDGSLADLAVASVSLSAAGSKYFQLQVYVSRVLFWTTITKILFAINSHRFLHKGIP